MLEWFKRRFSKDEKGQGMVEYGLILALISVVAIGSLTGIGDKVNDSFSKVSSELGGEVVDNPDNDGNGGGDVDNPDNEGNVGNSVTDSFINDQGYIPIANADDLNNLRNAETQTFAIGTRWEGEYTSGLDKKYIQVSDIDMSGIDNFEPIGDSGGWQAADRFTGSFDGGEYTIRNLKMDRSGMTHAESGGTAGLFGYIRDSTITNVKLEDVNIKGGRYVGGLVGNLGSSSISNSYVTGKVEGILMDVGGLAGLQSNSNIKNSYSTAVVSGSEANIGGLIGCSTNNSEIANSHATGNVNTNGNVSVVGGLVGYHRNSSIIRSYATGDVTGSRHDYGGLVGSQNMSSITNSYATGDVSSNQRPGGLVGGQNNSSIINSYATGKVVSLRDDGGALLAYNRNGSTVTDSGWASDVNSEMDGIGATYNAEEASNVVGLPKADIDNIIKNLIK